MDDLVDDAGAAIYADDVARVVLLERNTLPCLHQCIASVDSAFSDTVAKRNFIQNKRKRFGLHSGCGPGVLRETRRIHDNGSRLGYKFVPVTRYLGYMDSHNHSNAPEFRARVAAADRIFSFLRQFWRRGPRKLVRQVYRTAVIGTLVSGTAAAVPTSGDIH